MRPIDADALKERIISMARVTEKTTGSSAISSATVLVAINIEPTIEPKLVDGWIPCDEMMPEDGRWAIWYSKSGEVQAARYKVDGEDHFYPPGPLFRLEDAVAWMPLPKLYREEQD